MNPIKSLITLAPFTKAQIVHFNESEFAVLLMEMGFVPGEDVLVEITAPLGDPISLMVAGYNVSIRKTDAEAIMVREL